MSIKDISSYWLFQRKGIPTHEHRTHTINVLGGGGGLWQRIWLRYLFPGPQVIQFFHKEWQFCNWWMFIIFSHGSGSSIFFTAGLAVISLFAIFCLRPPQMINGSCLTKFFQILHILWKPRLRITCKLKITNCTKDSRAGYWLYCPFLKSVSFRYPSVEWLISRHTIN